MFIKIKPNAMALYRADFKNKAIPSFLWSSVLKCIENEWLEVETKHLFGNQFNTAPLKGGQFDRCIARLDNYERLSILKEVEDSLKLGLRVMIESVEYIVDDVRAGKGRCGYCGEVSQMNKICSHCNVCPKCKQEKYIENFEKFLKYQRTLWVKLPNPKHLFVVQKQGQWEKDGFYEVLDLFTDEIIFKSKDYDLCNKWIEEGIPS